MTALLKTLRRLAVCTAAFVALFSMSCGRPDSLVLVNVSGRDKSVTELHVTMTLDGTMAKNNQPTAEDSDNMSFTVYKDMDQFGIDVPTGTRALVIDIDGLNTARVIVQSGSGQLDFTQSKDLSVALVAK